METKLILKVAKLVIVLGIFATVYILRRRKAKSFLKYGEALPYNVEISDENLAYMAEGFPQLGKFFKRKHFADIYGLDIEGADLVLGGIYKPAPRYFVIVHYPQGLPAFHVCPKKSPLAKSIDKNALIQHPDMQKTYINMPLGQEEFDVFFTQEMLRMISANPDMEIFCPEANNKVIFTLETGRFSPRVPEELLFFVRGFVPAMYKSAQELYPLEEEEYTQEEDSPEDHQETQD